MVRAWESETGARKDEGKRRLGRIRVSHPIRLALGNLPPTSPSADFQLSSLTSTIDIGITQQTQTQELRYDNDKQRKCHQVLKRPSMSNSRTITLTELPARVLRFSHLKYLELWRRLKEMGKDESMQRLSVRRIRWQ